MRLTIISAISLLAITVRGIDAVTVNAGVVAVKNTEVAAVGVFCGGQSLSLGAQGTNLLSTNSVYPGKALMWTNGLLYGLDGEVVATNELNAYSDLVTGIDGTRGETPLAAAVRRYLAETESEGEAMPHVVGMTFGKGGTGISGLTVGTQPFSNFVNHLEMDSTIRAVGRTNYSASVMWIHGETDQAASMGYISYKSLFASMVSSMCAELDGKCPNASRRAKVFVSQPGNTTYSAVANCYVADALLDSASDNNRVVFVCPNYFLQRYSDGLHLTSASYVQLGEYFGVAMWEAERRGVFRALRPITVSATATNIAVGFDVEFAPLVWDTNAVSIVSNYGFSVVGGGSVSATPWIDGSTVNVPVSGSITAVRYAWANGTGSKDGPTEGQRGNLRDSCTRQALYGGTNLFNWCPIFELSVQ